MPKHIKLYIARMEKGYHQSDIARKLGIHQQTYHKKEKGKREFTISEAKKLGLIFNKSMDELFGEEA